MSFLTGAIKLQPFRVLPILSTAVVFTLILGQPALAETLQAEAPEISEAETSCFVEVPYPLVDASILPQDQVGAAKVYFRSIQGTNFYAVEMKPDAAGLFKAVLPVPSPETRQIVYYVEAVSPDFESSRTEEYVVDVVAPEECDEELFGGDDPEIVILSVVEGTALPPGFLVAGIAATVSVAGITTAVAASGGGLGAGAVAGIVAAGGVGAVVIADELDDDDEEPPVSPN